MESRSLLLVLRHAPYGRGLARAGFDLALAGAAFDQPVSLLFMDDGVWQLLPGQHPEAIGARSIERTLESLTLYDIESLYVDRSSLDQRGLHAQDLRDGVELVEAAALPGFIAGFQQVVSF